MSQFKLFIDENISRPLTHALAALLKAADERVTITHELDFSGEPGVGDEVWVPRLRDENWIVISLDLGHQPNNKLPNLCKRYGVTHVLASGKLVHRDNLTKVRALFAIWPKFKSVASSPPGSRFNLRSRNENFQLESASKPNQPL